MAGEMRGLERETFHALLLDGKHRLMREEMVSQGSLTASIVHPREVFRAAIREGAAALVVAHNHPSGDPSPSREDIDIIAPAVAAAQAEGINARGPLPGDTEAVLKLDLIIVTLRSINSATPSPVANRVRPPIDAMPIKCIG